MASATFFGLRLCSVLVLILKWGVEMMIEWLEGIVEKKKIRATARNIRVAKRR